MKKISMFLLAIVACISSASAASAIVYDHDRQIEFSALPAEAQQFVQKYFAKERVSFVELDEGIISNEYTVIFESGLKLEFDGAGNWTEVDCRYDAVPKALVPNKIASYVSSRYPDNHVVEIKRERHEWEVKLSGGLELCFDKAFRLVDIDD